MQPLDGTVSADGQRAGHRILLREEGVAGENPSLTQASDGCNVPEERWLHWCPAQLKGGNG